MSDVGRRRSGRAAIGKGVPQFTVSGLTQVCRTGEVAVHALRGDAFGCGYDPVKFSASAASPAEPN